MGGCETAGGGIGAGGVYLGGMAVTSANDGIGDALGGGNTCWGREAGVVMGGGVATAWLDARQMVADTVLHSIVRITWRAIRMVILWVGGSTR